MDFMELLKQAKTGNEPAIAEIIEVCTDHFLLRIQLLTERALMKICSRSLVLRC